MTKDELITKLANTGVFDTKNKYFEQYINLIFANLQTKNEKYKTNCHHIIPKCYFKIKHLDVDNSITNKVNLLYTDHILAHFYLGNCIIDKELKIYMLLALQYMGVSKDNINKLVADNSANEWYEQACKEKAKKHSERMKGNMPTPWNLGGGDCYTPEQREKLRNNLIGLHTKYWLGKTLPQEMKDKISNTLKGTHLSEETKQKISETNKNKGNGIGAKNGMYGTKYMTDGKETISVKKENIDKYLAIGYRFGKLRKLKNLKTNEIYWSIEDAATALNVSKAKIYKILARKKEEHKLLQRIDDDVKG